MKVMKTMIYLVTYCNSRSAALPTNKILPIEFVGGVELPQAGQTQGRQRTQPVVGQTHLLQSAGVKGAGGSTSRCGGFIRREHTLANLCVKRSMSQTL